MSNETADAAVEAEASLDRGTRRALRGLVTSDRMEKTVVVTVTTLKQHPLYGRTMKQSKKFKAHDESNECGIGDTIEIMECRPLSKDKRWRVVRILEKAK